MKEGPIIRLNCLYLNILKKLLLMKKLLYILSLAVVSVACKKDTTDPVDPVTGTPFDGSLTINSLSSLNDAISLGNQVATLSGDLTVTTGGSTGISAAFVGEVTQLITSVGGNVTITTPGEGLNLSNLTSVSGNYSVAGGDADDDALTTVGGNISLNYAGGYRMPNLTSAGDIDLARVSAQASKNEGSNLGLVNFPLVVANSISTVGDRDGMLDFGSSLITAVVLGPGVYLDYVVAPFASTIVSLYPSPLNSLFINAPNAETINMVTSSINGDVSVTSGGAIALPRLTTINGNVNITAPAIVANSLTSITGNLICSTNSVAMTSITTVGGNLNVTGITEGTNAASANFENLTNVGGDLNIEANEVSQDTGQPHNSGGSQHNSGGN